MARNEFTPSQAMTSRAVRSPSGRSVRTPVIRPRAVAQQRRSPWCEVTSTAPASTALSGQPRVEVGAERGAAVVRRLAPRRRAVVDGEGLGLGHDHRAAAGDPPLHRRLLPPARDQRVEDAAVDDAAVHVLRAGERAPLEQADPACRRGPAPARRSSRPGRHRRRSRRSRERRRRDRRRRPASGIGCVLRGAGRQAAGQLGHQGRRVGDDGQVGDATSSGSWRRCSPR